MSVVRVPDRYSTLMRTYNDLCCSRGKYYFTSYSDFAEEALSLMCRAAVLGREGCLLLLYHEYDNDQVPGGIERFLDVMTVGNNEKYIAQLLARLKKEGLESALEINEQMEAEVGFPPSFELQAIDRIGLCWGLDSSYRRAYVIIMGGEKGHLTCLTGASHSKKKDAMETLLEMANAKDSDLQKAYEAARKYLYWEKHHKPRKTKIERIVENYYKTQKSK